LLGGLLAGAPLIECRCMNDFKPWEPVVLNDATEMKL
jgi:hypothetical protein